MARQIERKLDGRGAHQLAWVEQRVADEVELVTRSRDAFGEWLSTLADWDLFATFTYDQRRGQDAGIVPRDYVGPISDFTSRGHVERYVRQAEKLLQRQLQVICALEHHASGWPHWHGLIAAGGLRAQDFGILVKLWYEAHGYIRLEAPRDKQPFPYEVDPKRGADCDTSPLAVAAYCAKYLVKDDGFSVFEVHGETATQRVLEAARATSPAGAGRKHRRRSPRA